MKNWVFKSELYLFVDITFNEGIYLNQLEQTLKEDHVINI